MAAPKHVIFLGAGASASSGYPLANRLTLLMCDARTFEDALQEAIVEEEAADPDNQFYRALRRSVFEYYRSLEPATGMLRNGDFLTMDELSLYARGGAHDKLVPMLKKAMRLVLALNSPDRRNYADSDYRKFVQKLFVNGLLREDVAILSFNYDPYFEFRLSRAFGRRSLLRQYEPSLKELLNVSIHSGLSSPKEYAWLQRQGFCHLKLHGTAVFPWTSEAQGDETQLHAGDLCALSVTERLRRVVRLGETAVPALLPWEIIDRSGNLLSETAFKKTVGDTWEHSRLYPLFSGIWQRARAEVQQASKVSFVGISMHEYLIPGLKYLFRGKAGPLQLVVATRVTEQSTQMEMPPVVGRTIEVLLEHTDSSLELQQSAQAISQLPDWTQFQRAKQAFTSPEVTIRGSFDEFLETELQPGPGEKQFHQIGVQPENS